MVAGIGLVVVNMTMQLSRDLTLLPGGHSVLYMIAGILIAAYGTWWLGWYDRPTVPQG
jgi:hypothetical protein